jgi:DNA polymerase-3 subunit beta
MEFLISREALLKPLQKVVGAVERRHTMPILGNLLLVVKNQLLSLTATDLEIELVVRVPLAAPATAGEITVPARKLLDICKALPDKAELTFKVFEHKAELKSGRSRFTLACLPAADFPRVEEGPGKVECALSQTLLRGLIDATSFAMAHQDVRYYLNGMLLEFSAQYLRAVAADGHRLAVATLDIKNRIEALTAVIVPRKAIIELQRLFGEGEEEIGLVIGDNHLRAITPNFSFSTKLIDGKFPDYRQVIPQLTEAQHAVIARKSFKEALARVSVLFSDKYRGAGIQFKPGLMTIVAHNPEKDEVEESFEIDYNGPELEIGFNISYLQEYLNYLKSETMQMSFSDANQSVLCEPLFNVAENARTQPQQTELYVVMPMRL